MVQTRAQRRAAEEAAKQAPPTSPSVPLPVDVSKVTSQKTKKASKLKIRSENDKNQKSPSLEKKTDVQVVEKTPTRVTKHVDATDDVIVVFESPKNFPGEKQAKIREKTPEELRLEANWDTTIFESDPSSESTDDVDVFIDDDSLNRSEIETVPYLEDWKNANSCRMIIDFEKIKLGAKSRKSNNITLRTPSCSGAAPNSTTLTIEKRRSKSESEARTPSRTSLNLKLRPHAMLKSILKETSRGKSRRVIWGANIIHYFKAETNSEDVENDGDVEVVEIQEKPSEPFKLPPSLLFSVRDLLR